MSMLFSVRVGSTFSMAFTSVENVESDLSGRGWTSLSCKEVLPGCSVAVACTLRFQQYLG
jgi:hypothetical protein